MDKELTPVQAAKLFIQGFNFGAQSFLELTNQNVKDVLLTAPQDTAREFAEKLRERAKQLQRTADFTKWYNSILKTKNKQYVKVAPANDFLPDEVHKQFDFGEYEINDRGLAIFNDKTGHVYFAKGTPCYVSKILNNADGDGVKYEVTYKVDHKWQSVIFGKDTLSDKNKILTLSSTDISVTSESSKDLVRFMEDFVALNRDKIPRAKSIGRLGWINGDFVPYLKDFEFDGTIDETKRFEAMRESGSFDLWKSTTNEAIKYNRAVRFSIAGSCASPLLNVINSQMFIVHLWGETEIGKTVSLLHAMSIWGDPKELTNITFNGTAVGLEMIARFYKHCCLPINELQAIQSKYTDFGTMIFKLCEGVSKLRGAKGGGLQRQDTWNMVILSNGNQPLNEENSQAGAVNRVIEIYENKALYKNPKQVCDVIFDNYGYAGKLIIDTIKQDRLLWKQRHKHCVDFITNESRYKGTDKHRNGLAVLMLGDILYQMSINGTDYETALKDTKYFITDNMDIFKSIDEVKLSVRSYDHLRSWIAQNKGYFGYVGEDGKDYFPGDKVYGIVEKSFIYILPTAFDEWAKVFGISKTAVLEEWQQSGTLLTTGAGKERRVTRKNEHYYKIIIKNTDKTLIKESKQVELEDLIPVEDGDLPF